MNWGSFAGWGRSKDSWSFHTQVWLHKSKPTRAGMAVRLLIKGLPFLGAGDSENMKTIAGPLLTQGLHWGYLHGWCCWGRQPLSYLLKEMCQPSWDKFQTHQLSQALFSSRLTSLQNNRTSGFAEMLTVLVQISFSHMLPVAFFLSVLALLLLFHLKHLLLDLEKASLLPTVPSRWNEQLLNAQSKEARKMRGGWGGGSVSFWSFTVIF